MIPRVVKRETATQLELTLKLFVDTVQLRLDKVVCLKCDICAKVCPREAVIIIPAATMAWTSPSTPASA